MAATFTALLLPGTGRPALTRPAAGVAGAASTGGDVGATAAVQAHEADPNPHPELDERLQYVEQAPRSACRCAELEARIAALEQAP